MDKQAITILRCYHGYDSVMFYTFQLRMRRLASLKSNKTINDRDRANLNTILQTTEYISSEESDFVSGPSGSEDDEEPKVKILVKRKLPWRSCYVNELFAELDKGTEKRRRRSKHVGSMTMERREGWASTRKEPVDCEAYALMVYDEP